MAIAIKPLLALGSNSHKCADTFVNWYKMFYSALRCKQKNVETMTGAELRQAIANKWDYSYDVQLRKTQGKIFLQVMWRYQEQQSFSMNEAEFIQHLDTIASYLSDWGVVEQVQKFIEITKERPRLGKAVSIPLQIGERSLEWLIGN